jgi:hypothetical protein
MEVNSRLLAAPKQRRASIGTAKSGALELE